MSLEAGEVASFISEFIRWSEKRSVPFGSELDTLTRRARGLLSDLSDTVPANRPPEAGPRGRLILPS